MKSFNLQALIFALILFSPKYSISQTTVQRIAAYDKVWGFIKYHHPNVATGNIDWDSVYIAHINQVITAKSNILFNRQIDLLIKAAGPVKKIVPIKISDNLFKANFDLFWLNDTQTFNNQNRKKLKVIYRNRNQGYNRFIKYNNQSDFSGEKNYQEISFPNAEYRQLFLARFWNVINYFDPNKYLIGEYWGDILKRFIPKFTEASDKFSYYKALLKLSVSLHNGHSYVSIAGDDSPINNLLYGKYTAPFYAQIIAGVAIIRKTANDSLCNNAGLEKGNIILEINRISISKKIKQLRTYVSGSNKVAQNGIIAWRLFDTHYISEKLKIKRGNRIFSTIVKCIPVNSKNWVDINNYTANQTGYKSISNLIAYIYAAQIFSSNLDTIRKIIMRSKAVIFDVRNYPGQEDFFNIMGIMLPEPKIINFSTVFTTDNPGMFTWKPSFKIGDVNPKYFKGKTIILVDERSQSQGEYSAMVLQTIPGSITIGSQTAGADGAVSPISMGNKISIGFSGYGIYYPDKSPTQRVGVKIDIPVNKTVQSIVDDRDLVLEKALAYLSSLGIK